MPHTWLASATPAPYSPTASLRHVRGSPALGLLRRLRPPRETSPDWAACRADAWRSREVPWFKRSTLDAVGGQLDPWLRRPYAASGQGVGASLSDARSRICKTNRARAASPLGAGLSSVQRLVALTSREGTINPLVFTMASAVARLGASLLADISGRSAFAGRRSHLGDVHGPLLHPARPGRG